MRDGLGLVGVAILSVVCCAGLPLLLAVGMSAALAWIGGLTFGLAALAIAIAMLVVRARKTASAVPSDRRSAEVRR